MILPGQDQRIENLGHISHSKNIIRPRKHEEMMYMAICFTVRGHTDVVFVCSLTVNMAVFRIWAHGQIEGQQENSDKADLTIMLENAVILQDIPYTVYLVEDQHT